MRHSQQELKAIHKSNWMRRLHACFIMQLLVALCMLTAIPALAQSVSGTLAGNVQDQKGGAILGARITIVGGDTGITYTAVSSDAGVYRVGGILPGKYNVTVEAKGFEKAVRTEVSVEISVVTALDVTMTVGSEAATMTVSADAPTLSTESSDISTTITSRQVEELPLSLGGIGQLRSVEAFVFLTPGVEGGAGSLGVFSQRISGGQMMGQEVLLDGASVDRSDWHSEIDETAPSVDALQEFTVETSTIPAEYSRTAGGIVTFTTKTGTNKFHGMAYDILKNEDLDANSWFSNGYIAQNGNTAAARAQFARGIDKKNDYGGTFSGPVRIPYLYNGRDKSFFFFSWEQFRQSAGQTAVSTLPTAKERTGDFSELLGPVLMNNNAQVINSCDGTPIYQGQIFDPATTTTDAKGQPCRTAFAGNVVPSGRFSNVANNVVALLPPLLNGNLKNNYAFTNSEPILNTAYTIRADQVISESQKIAVSYSHRLNSAPVGGGPTLPYPLDPGHQSLTFHTIYSRVIYDITPTPSLTNSVILGYNRFDSASQLPTATAGTDWSAKIGIKNVSPNDDDFPQLTFGDAQGITQLGSNVNNRSYDNGYRLNDRAAWVKGKHSIDFGFNSAYQEFAPNNFAGTNGLFNFSFNQTAPNPSSDKTTGSAWASFLLGQPTTGTSLADRSAQQQWHSNYYAYYAQDTYKVRSNLVVNYGVNWSIETPRHELHNRMAEWDPDLYNPGSGTLGAVQFASSSNRSFLKTYYGDISPRVGFSWSPQFLHNRTTVRGGYGIYYSSLFYGDTGGRLTDGFTTTSNQVSPDGGFTAAFNIDNGFPNFAHAPFKKPDVDNGNGVSGYLEPGYNRPGYIQNRSFQIQQELAHDLILSVAYVGTKGNRLRSEFREINAVQEHALSLGTVLGEGINSQDAQTAGITNPFPTFQNIWGSGVNVGQALRKWPQVNNINTGDILENYGQSSYNALQMQLQRKFTNGLNLLVSYTWAKTLSDSDGFLPFFAEVNNGGAVQNPYNRRAEKAISNEDTPQVFVASYIYELPVGKGKKFLNNAPAPVNAAIGGWQIGGIQRYQSGQPLQICCGVGVPDLDSNMRPNWTGKPLKLNGGQGNGFNPFGTHNVWLNGAALTDANPNRGPFVPWQFGNVPRVYGGARTQLFSDEDFSIIKKTPIVEGIYLEFRAEMFNAFNRHIFSAGDTGFGDTGFGTVTGTSNGPRNVQGTLKLHF